MSDAVTPEQLAEIENRFYADVPTNRRDFATLIVALREAWAERDAARGLLNQIAIARPGFTRWRVGGEPAREFYEHLQNLAASSPPSTVQPLTWRSEPPTEPGWWQWRNKQEQRGGFMVCALNRIETPVLRDTAGVQWSPHDYWIKRCEWAGPIVVREPEPREPAPEVES